MTAPLKNANAICPHWRGSLIESAFEDLSRGIEREQRRLQGAAYLVLAIKHEQNYDGITDSIESLDGFPSEQLAIEHADSWIAAHFAATKASLHKTKPAWDFDPAPSDKRVLPTSNGPQIVGSHLRSYRARRPGMYEALCVQAEVLRIDTPAVISPALFAYVNEQWAWQRYLIDRGSLAPAPQASDSRKLGQRILRRLGTLAKRVGSLR